MAKTLGECHSDVVKMLEKRGEPVYNEVNKSISGTPKVYVKGRKFGTKEFLCGTALMKKDGTIDIIQDPLTDLRGIGGFKIEELGLCDRVMVYANDDHKTYPRKVKETPKPLSVEERLDRIEEVLLKLMLEKEDHDPDF